MDKGSRLFRTKRRRRLQGSQECSSTGSHSDETSETWENSEGLKPNTLKGNHSHRFPLSCAQIRQLTTKTNEQTLAPRAIDPFLNQWRRSFDFIPFLSFPSRTTFGLYIGGSTRVGLMSEMRMSLGEPPIESCGKRARSRSTLEWNLLVTTRCQKTLYILNIYHKSSKDLLFRTQAAFQFRVSILRRAHSQDGFFIMLLKFCTSLPEVEGYNTCTSVSQSAFQELYWQNTATYWQHDN